MGHWALGIGQAGSVGGVGGVGGCGRNLSPTLPTLPTLPHLSLSPSPFTDFCKKSNDYDGEGDVYLCQFEKRILQMDFQNQNVQSNS